MRAAKGKNHNQTFLHEISTTTSGDLHPRMADHYKNEVNQLIEAMELGDHNTATQNAIRALIEKIVLTPQKDGDGLYVNLHGDLAGILAMAQKLEKSTRSRAKSSDPAMSPQVAGAPVHGLKHHNAILQVAGADSRKPI